MTAKSKFAIFVAKFVRGVLRITNHKATSLPGLVAFKLDKNVLEDLGQNTKFVMITGTNGKTMTTHFCSSVLREKYDYVFTNDSGSNMIQGIITSLLDNPRDKETVAVLEVDEANLKRVTGFIKPDYVIFTNVFRDQMDRFGEVYNILNQMLLGVEKVKDTTTILANGDLPMFSYDAMAGYKKKYFGINDSDIKSEDYDLDAERDSDGIICPSCHSILKYKQVNYSSMGDFKCPSCGFKRPDLSYKVDEIAYMDSSSSKFVIDGRTYEINLGGFYNIYNALAAYSLGKEFGISDEKIYQGLKKQKNLSGRQESFTYGGKEISINLVKNPTGLNQVIRLMLYDKRPLSLLVLLNNKYADGLDVSRIYDGYFEMLRELPITDVYVGGTCKEDVKTRLQIARIFDGDLVEVDLDETIKGVIKNAKSQRVVVLSTYTAMNQLREILELDEN